MKKWLFLLIIFLIPTSVLANTNVNIYLFERDGCPHCHEALNYFNELKKMDDTIKVYDYEITKEANAYNRTLFNKACETLDIHISSVPLIIIGNDYLVGFSNSKKDAIDKLIKFYHENDYKDIVGINLGIIDENNNPIIKSKEKDYILDTIFGKINLQNLSLPLITIIVGFVDGFNPCAMWILLFLITMLFNMKNKKKMWILGLTFIGTSGFIYFLFMMAWLNVNSFINQVHQLQIAIGLFSLIFGTINIYHYFKERKENGCVVIKKEKRRLVFSRIKKIVENKSFTFSIIGIIALAIVVNLIELLCSLGLPVMYTEILSLNNLTDNQYLRYILLYILFFLLDDIIVFVISMVTLKSTAISTKYNKYSHLIGGIIMILIGILIILKPEWLAFNFK